MLELLEINSPIRKLIPMNYISLKNILGQSSTVDTFNRTAFTGICVLLVLIVILSKALFFVWKSEEKKQLDTK